MSARPWPSDFREFARSRLLDGTRHGGDASMRPGCWPIRVGSSSPRWPWGARFDRCTGTLAALAFVLGVLTLVVGGLDVAVIGGAVPSRTLGAAFVTAPQKSPRRTSRECAIFRVRPDPATGPERTGFRRPSRLASSASIQILWPGFSECLHQRGAAIRRQLKSMFSSPNLRTDHMVDYFSFFLSARLYGIEG